MLAILDRTQHSDIRGVLIRGEIDIRPMSILWLRCRWGSIIDVYSLTDKEVLWRDDFLDLGFS